MLHVTWNLQNQNDKDDLPHSLKLVPTILRPRLINVIACTAVSFTLHKNQGFQSVSAACKSLQEGGTQAALCIKHGMDQKVTFKSLSSAFTAQVSAHFTVSIRHFIIRILCSKSKIQSHPSLQLIILRLLKGNDLERRRDFIFSYQEVISMFATNFGKI